ncbi:MAG: PEGA domain-containing protein [Terriglobia bacterium]
MIRSKGIIMSLLVIVSVMLSLPGLSYSQNKTMGEVDFIGVTKLDQHSGVWIDGEYVGYISELKGARKVLLLPGNHKVTVRQLGYKDFTQRITVEPGQTQTITVSLERDPRYRIPSITAELKLDVTPDRAAVFVDGGFIGPASDFGGARRALLLKPGKHQIKIAMPGYQTSDTVVNLLPHQKFTLRTQLEKGSINQAGPLIKKHPAR